MAPARRSTRSSRDSKRSAPSGRSSRDSARSSARSNARPGSSRRTTHEEDDPRSSGRRSARESSRGGASAKNDTTIIIAGVVGAVVVLGAGLLLLSGGKKRVRNMERAPVPKATHVATMDFFHEGMSRGYDWKSRMRDRRTPFTDDEVREVADRMKWDYTKKGIEGPGEKRFVDGFVKAVLGK